MPEKKQYIAPKFDDDIEKEAHFCWAVNSLPPQQADQIIRGKAHITFDAACLFGDPNFKWLVTKHNQ